MRITDGDLCGCLANDMLQLILLPTEACNFRCVYCYEDFQYNKMAPSVVRGVKNYLTLRAPELSALTVSWFGGEPLLAREIIDDVLIHVHSLLRAHSGIHFFSDITTNAYLLDRPLFERLLALGVTQYQIAFDGPQQWHDKMRKLANGRGTYQRIWDNVTAMREVKGDFKIILRLHVSMENDVAAPQFIDEYRKTFGNDPRFTLFLRPLSRLGGANDPILPVFDAKQGGKAIKALSKCAEEHRVEHVTLKDVTPICYASRANSFVVRANGRLNKCTVALEHPLNQIGQIREDGSLQIESKKMLPWMRGIQSRDMAELECPMHGLVESQGRQNSRQRRGPAPLPQSDCDLNADGVTSQDL